MKRTAGVNQLDGMSTQQSLGLVLKRLLKLRDAEIFRNPVDWKGMGLDDYPTVIKEPMDLGTMMEKNSSGKYNQGDAVFWSDLELIWHNCELYNGADGTYGRLAQRMREACARTQHQYHNKQSASGVGDSSKRSGNRSGRREDSSTRSKKAGRPPLIKKEASTEDTIGVQPLQSSSYPISSAVSSSNISMTSPHESKVSSLHQYQQGPPSGSKGNYVRSADSIHEKVEPQQQIPIATEPYKIHDPKNAAIAAAVSVRMLQLNACALTILIRYIMNLQASRPDDEKRSGPIIRPNTLEEKQGARGEPNHSATQRESVRLDIGRLEIHELKAVYQLVERMIESGLVHQYDQQATTAEEG